MDLDLMSQQILTRLDRIQIDIQELKTDVQELKTDVQEIKTDVQELKTSNSVIKAQTAQLTEFHTETNEKLDQIIDDLEFLKSKEYQNEKDLFKLKKVIKLVE